MTIGQVAKAVGVGVETVRFYEREGLIEEPPRRVSGYRNYGSDVVRRLLFVRRAKELGFTLKEIKEMLALRIARRASCATVQQRAESKITDIDARIRSLRKMKRALQTLTDACARGDTATGQCPLLDALEGELLQ